jgi:hypothetical protein
MHPVMPVLILLSSAKRTWGIGFRPALTPFGHRPDRLPNIRNPSRVESEMRTTMDIRMSVGKLGSEYR